MFIIGVAYYPLFACMATDYKITGFVIGFLYSGVWLVCLSCNFLFLRQKCKVFEFQVVLFLLVYLKIYPLPLTGFLF